LLGNFKSGQENKYDKAKVDGPATTEALFKLTGELSAEELKRAQDWERNQGAAGYVAPAEFGAADSETPDDGYPRRHVLARLMNLRAGLTAVKPALPADSQKQVDAIVAAVTPVIKAAGDEKTISRRVTDTIRSMNQAIVATVGDIGGASEDDDQFTAGGAPPAAVPAGAPPAATAVAPEAELVEAPGTAPAAASEAPATPAPAAEVPPAEPPAATPPATVPIEGAKN
jgi:hypothetical protein